MRTPFGAIRSFLVFCSILFSVISSSATVFAQQPLLTKESQQTAFETMLSELEVHYGMIKFKTETFGITYDGLREKYNFLIKNALTLEEYDAGLKKGARKILPPEEFRQLMIGFGAEFKDGHTNILRNTTHFWTLGIHTAAIEGKLYVVGFDPEIYLPEFLDQPLSVGDEVVSINGKSVQELAKENLRYISLATHESRMQRALENLLEVGHRRFRAKKTGELVNVVFKHHEEGHEKTIRGNFHWINRKDLRDFDHMVDTLRPYHRPEKNPEETPFIFGEDGLRTQFREGLKTAILEGKLTEGSIVNLGKLQNIEILEAKKHIELKKKNKQSINEKLSHFARLSPINRLEVYMVRYDDKNIGVIRIPNYSPDRFSDVYREFKWLAFLVAQMETTTDALIIDQNNNGGGYVDAGIKLTRLFAPEHGLTAGTIDAKLSLTFLTNNSDAKSKQTEKDLNAMADHDHDYDHDELPEDVLNFAKVFLTKEAFEKLKQKYEAGESWSGPIPHMGSNADFTPNHYGKIMQIQGVHYTKPIVFLNDSRSASCGDFVPSILQANKRAVVFGETSMGLGGPVYRNTPSISSAEMYMRCTYGYCERADKLPIENIGVVPDIYRPMTHFDLENQFQLYALDALNTAVRLIEGASVAEIQKQINAQKNHLEKVKNSAKIKALQKELNAFAAKQKQESNASNPKKIEELVKSYERFFKQIAELKASDPNFENYRIVLPLPVVILKNDAVLSSLSDSASVINRLEELEQVSRYQGRKNQPILKLMRLLKKRIGEFAPLVFKPDFCHFLLTKK